MRAKRSIRGLPTHFSISFRARKNSPTRFSHSAPSAGASVFGQYPAGQSGDTCFGYKVKSKMSRCASRTCSSKSQTECGDPAGRTPRCAASKPASACFQSACASRQSRTFRNCSRSALSFTPPPAATRVVFAPAFLVDFFFVCCLLFRLVAMLSSPPISKFQCQLLWSAGACSRFHDQFRVAQLDLAAACRRHRQPRPITRRLFLPPTQRYNPADIFTQVPPIDRPPPSPPQLPPHLRTISSRRNRRAPPAAPEPTPIRCVAKQTDAPGPHPPQLQRKSLRPVAQGPRSPSRLRLHRQPLPRRSLSRSNHLPRAKIQPEARKHHPRLRLHGNPPRCRRRLPRSHPQRSRRRPHFRSRARLRPRPAFERRAKPAHRRPSPRSPQNGLRLHLENRRRLHLQSQQSHRHHRHPR